MNIKNRNTTAIGVAQGSSATTGCRSAVSDGDLVVSVLPERFRSTSAPIGSIVRREFSSTSEPMASPKRYSHAMFSSSSKAHAVTTGKFEVTNEVAGEGGNLTVNGSARPLDSGVLVLSDHQYEHFEKCMNNPAQPTKMMVEAAEQIRNFAAKRRS